MRTRFDELQILVSTERTCIRVVKVVYEVTDPDFHNVGGSVDVLFVPFQIYLFIFMQKKVLKHYSC